MHSMKKFFVFLTILCTAVCPLVSRSQGAWYELGGQLSSMHVGNSLVTHDASGTVYAVLGRGVFKWDGSSWTELGDGPTALNIGVKIRGITVDPNGKVYVAGEFKNAARLCYVAVWDGTTWSELGAGSSLMNYQSTLTSLTSDAAGNIYAGADIRLS